MKQSGSPRRNSSWLKPLLVIAVATLFTAACKESAVQGSSGSSSPSGGSSGAPPSGGMPAPGGGTPSPSGSSGGSSGSGAPSPSGGSTDGGASGGSSGGAGDVGAIPPPPGQGGGGGGMEGESGGGADGGGDVSGGGGVENPFGNADSSDSDSDAECGDTGALPGGIGGMGREGECLSSESAAASESDSESESSSSAAESGGGGGGSSGGGASSSGASTGTGGAGSVGEFPEESSAERADRLGRELDESIGGFDETLGAEQREIAAAGRVVEGYDIAGEEGQGSGGLISLGGQAASTEGQSGSVGGGRTPVSEPLAGLTQQDIEELTPDDIPTMVDDDIIARQLREAAIVEENPDLRDRLWDEYRKYKGISVGD